MFGSRILILAPHPDDEVVACAAAARRALAGGAEIFVYFLTDGCIARETLWPWQRGQHEANVQRRLGEAREAAKFLGLRPVGFAQRPARHLWRNMREVAGEIRRAAATHQIDQIWIPAYEGGNADHDGLNGLCAAIRDSLPPILEFAEYNFAGGRKHSQDFPAPNGTETVLRLTREEKEIKLRALSLYASEKLNLNYVETEREAFRPLTAYDYTKPAHDGTLWYARFQWVPFRHPRVDFTKPQEVCAALTSFASATAPQAPARQ